MPIASISPSISAKTGRPGATRLKEAAHDAGTPSDANRSITSRRRQNLQRGMSFHYRSIVALALALIAGIADARPSGPVDPNWPCQALKVPPFQLTLVWPGPPIDGAASGWRDDDDVAAFVREIAQRRVPLNEAQARIETFAQNAGANRQAKLLKVVVGLFSVMNAERSSVIDGLDRAGARQKELAAALRHDNERLQQLQSGAKASSAQANQLQLKVTWEAEVYQDRRQSLRYACDVPGKIEQRLLALTKTVSQQLQ
jgi:hypothetical protein